MTGLGLSSYEPKGELIGQGSLGGALISACNLDKDVDDYFRDSDVIYYGNVRIQPLLFQDDVIHLSNSRDNTHSAVTRMESVMKSN